MAMASAACLASDAAFPNRPHRDGLAHAPEARSNSRHHYPNRVYSPRRPRHPGDKDRGAVWVELRGEVIALVQKNHNGVPIIAENNQSKLSSFKSSPNGRLETALGGTTWISLALVGGFETETPVTKNTPTPLACRVRSGKATNRTSPRATPKNTWRGHAL